MWNRIFAALAAFASVGGAGVAHGVTMFGLTSENGLVSFDSASPGTVATVGTITQPGIVDIDFSPANGRLYGVTAGGALYWIGTSDAAATLAVNPSIVLSNITDLDFNPAADRGRLFGLVDQNYRIAPDASAITAPQTGTPGAVLVDGTFTNPAVDLVGNAYTNNFDGTPATTLYSIDTAGDQLIVHSVAPEFNTVTAVGPLGVAVGSNVGFDIDANGGVWVSDDSFFYTANLGSGGLSLVGGIGTDGVVSIAAIPEPGTALLAAMGLGWLARRRRGGRSIV